MIIMWGFDLCYPFAYKVSKNTPRDPWYSDVRYSDHHCVQHFRLKFQVLNRWATPVNQLRSQTHRALREYLKDEKISYSSHYGALCALIALGPAVLDECLLPQMDQYLNNTKEKVSWPSRSCIEVTPWSHRPISSDSCRSLLSSKI